MGACPGTLLYEWSRMLKQWRVKEVSRKSRPTCVIDVMYSTTTSAKGAASGPFRTIWTSGMVTMISN